MIHKRMDTQDMPQGFELNRELYQNEHQDSIYEEQTERLGEQIVKINSDFVYQNSIEQSPASRKIQYSPIHQNMPTFSVIQKSLQNLKAIVPEMFGDEFVDQFYNKVFQKIYQHKLNNKTDHIQKRELSLNKSKDTSILCKSTVQNKIPNIYSSRSRFINMECKSQLEASRIRNELQIQNRSVASIKLEQVCQNYQTVNQKEIIEIVKIVAAVFCERGYNLKAIEQRMTSKNLAACKDQINFYKIVSHIVYNAYEFLYTLLVHDCKKTYLPLTKHFGEQFLVNFLIDCGRNLQPSVCNIFYKIIKGQCGLVNQQLTPVNAVKLYKQIQAKLKVLYRKQEKNKNRIKDKLKYGTTGPFQKDILLDDKILTQKEADISPKPLRPKIIDEVNAMNKVWNSRYQHEFITVYKQGKPMNEIIAYFKKIFPNDSDFFSAAALRSQLYKMLRKSIKKLYRLIYDYGTNKLPQIKRLKDYQSKAILYNIEAYDVRKYLLEIYRCEQYDERLMIDVIREMTNYITYLQTIRRMANHVGMGFDQAKKKRGKIFPYNPRNFNQS